MRDIKFRAWDKKSKKMRVVYCIVYDTYSKFSKNHKIKIVNLWGKVFPAYDDGECNTDIQIQREPKQVELMQYTGLKDKNGVEIYEGDILKISNISVLRCEFKNGCFVLIHSKEFAGVDNLLWGNLGRLYDTNMNDIFELTEVIGNIYENTELLETT